MNFEDLIGIIIFISIVVISSIFRAIKEAREARQKKEVTEQSQYPKTESLETEPEQPYIPKRKIVIKTEDVEIPIPPSMEREERIPTPQIFQKTQTVEEGKSLELSARSLEDEYEGEGSPYGRERISPTEAVKEKIEKLQEKVQKKETGKLPTLVKPLYKKEITFTAPMERTPYTTTTSTLVSRNIVSGTVGGVPQLQWAIIMMELLGPPKSLRDDF